MHKQRIQPVSAPAELKPLLDAIRQRLAPESIWLFGSRARGDERGDSDWDLLVALPDDAPDGDLDPLVGWNLQREVGIPATIVTMKATDLEDGWGSPNTLGYDLARHGQLLHVRS